MSDGGEEGWGKRSYEISYWKDLCDNIEESYQRLMPYRQFIFNNLITLYLKNVAESKLKRF